MLPTLPGDNPFAAPSELPFGLPPFDRIQVEHYLPAVEAGLAEQAAEVRTIADDPAPATFDNTIVALERSGRLLDRVLFVLYNLASSDTTPQLQRIQAEIAPKIAAHRDAILLDQALFGRIKDLFERRDDLGLDAESGYLLERYHTDFLRSGAALDEAARDRLRELNQELSSLSTAFQEKLLAESNDLAVVVDDESELDGLSPDAIASAAEAATARGLSGKYLLTLILPSSQPALASLTNRSVRERVYKASVARGARGNENDTSSTLIRIAALRARKAAVLGHPHHASYVIADETAGSAEAALALLERLAPVAVANARVEAEELQRLLEQDVPGATLEAWDWAFYAERVRRERFAVDSAQLREYFELDRVLHDGVFFAATKLYGLTFTERTDLPVYHEGVRVFEVSDEDGSPIGLFLGDYHTRDAKRGGAWMNSYSDQSSLLGTLPVVVNNLNIPKPPAGEPTLMTFDEVTTAFHEFGHALHGLLSDVKYPKFTGTSVPRDFVEFPSQVNEMWMLWPEVLANYARHYKTGEPLPAELVEKLQASTQYGEGFATTEYLAAALLDQAWHRLGTEDVVEDVAQFEAAALEKAGVAVAAIPPRYRSTYFAHIFSGGYAAGYYSYIWSEVLDADTVEWFRANGGLRRENGDAFRRGLLSRGGSVPAMDAFRDVVGRDPEIGPLLQRRGLTGA
ncbi:M3 family metallopeptidase [Labedaea rhizosphaerae]|uniref:Peptidyl-dipeptidase Dcp n=1 Tax=Labedaea rhizosphaerae TaxID=598644 RepID=A0A4R6S9H1_LABRH|nr:M3 family metallopeptidase [Labedaea rhizosphaerae]TDP96649.1 peptidyl-dipeptidase Dcp [Labedaea rhizosphaerae]